MQESTVKSIVPILNKNSGCDYHRIFLPYSYLGVDFKKLDGMRFEDIAKDTRLLVFNRTAKQSLLPYLYYKNKHGFKILVDLDDYWELYYKHELNKEWVKQKMGEQIILSLKNADAVTVTTSLLADKVKQYNKNVHVIPNALPFGDDQFNSDKNPSDKLRFIYAGGSSHLHDLKELSVPFQKVNNNPNIIDNCTFTLAGIPLNPPKEWQRIENCFTLNGKLKSYNKITVKKLSEYMDVYKDGDICLVPLEGNPFNARKSNLKIIESGCKYNPVICSDVSPYADEPNRDIIMFAKNTREWYEHIKYCVENPHFVHEKGQQLGEYVRQNYDLRKINQYREQLIENLIK